MEQFYSRLEDFKDSLGLDPAAFETRWAAGFLVFRGTQIGGEVDVTHTGAIKVADVRAMLAGKTEHARNYVGGSLVFLVKSAGRAATTAFISIGRTPNNDVVLSDPSVSGFHALITRDPEGNRRLQDAGSTNGTFVGDVSAPGRDAKEGVLLERGAELRIGALKLVYCDVEEFMQMVREVTGS